MLAANLVWRLGLVKLFILFPRLLPAFAVLAMLALTATGGLAQSVAPAPRIACTEQREQCVKQDLTFVWKSANDCHCRGAAVAKKQSPVPAAASGAKATASAKTIAPARVARKQQVRRAAKKRPALAEVARESW
jgi:hypothetical protein